MYSEKPLKEFVRELLKREGVILCSDVHIVQKSFYDAILNAGYRDVTVKQLQDILIEIDRESRSSYN